MAAVTSVAARVADRQPYSLAVVSPMSMVRVLGPVDVIDRVGSVHEIPGRRAQALLCRLVSDAGRVVSADALIDAVWADGSVDAPAPALQSQVFRLRKRIEGVGGPTIETRAPGYQLVLGDAQVDAVEFERSIAAAADLEPSAAVIELEHALAL